MDEPLLKLKKAGANFESPIFLEECRSGFFETNGKTSLENPKIQMTSLS